MRAFSWCPWIPGTLKLDSLLSLFKCGDCFNRPNCKWGTAWFAPDSFKLHLALLMDSLHYLGHNTCDYSKEAYYYYTFATIVSPSTVIWRENDGLEKLRYILKKNPLFGCFGSHTEKGPGDSIKNPHQTRFWKPAATSLGGLARSPWALQSNTKSTLKKQKILKRIIIMYTIELQEGGTQGGSKWGGGEVQ